MDGVDFKTIIQEAIKGAQDGSLNSADAETLLRAIADALEAVHEGGVLPDRVWVRIAIQGALVVLRNTADELSGIAADEETP